MKRSKRATTSTQILVVSAVSVLFILISVLGIYKCFSRAPSLDPIPSVSPGQTDAVSPANPESPAQPDPGEPLQEERKDSFYTILIGGLDAENGGSDTNLLVSLNAKDDEIHVVSLPRDTLLNVSWSVKKLNSAYRHGGFASTMSEVSNLLGIPVDFYITVDLDAFVELVDAIEGVEFDVPTDMNYDDPYQDLHIHLSAGYQHLDGEEALQVVRWRQNNDGSGYATADIGRISTQQAFLTAMAKQTLQLSNVDKLPEMARIFREHVQTDLKLENLVWIGEQALTMGSDSIHFHTLPGDGAGYYKGVSYYVLDGEQTLEIINNWFNPYQRPLTLDDMDIFVP